MSIEDWRAQIDEVDRDLLELLNKRASLAVQIGALKRRAAIPLYDAGRERDVLARVCRDNRGPLDDGAVAALFRHIIRASRRVEAQGETQDAGQREGVL